MFYFGKRDVGREFARKRKENGRFARVLDFGADAKRRWAVQVFDRPVPEGAVVTK